MYVISISCFIGLIFIAGIGVAFAHPAFGRSPRGERLNRIKQSAHYIDGQFQNTSPTPVMAEEDENTFKSLWNFLFKKEEGLKPNHSLTAKKVDLFQIDRSIDFIQWLGHSSIYLQIDQKRILVDPVLTNKWPVSMMLKPFKGTSIYSPSDIPDIDLLIITHDHWDHLDYHTIKQLNKRVKQIICPLGVGEHIEHWGVNPEIIVEMDWNEQVVFDHSVVIDCLPARHFSGRLFKRNQTLWASFMIQTTDRKIYFSGDGGYDTHFKEIGERFAPIDIAFVENGQYNNKWRFIHLMPSDLIDAINDLNASHVLTTHHGKYSLAKHHWQEPIINIAENTDRFSSHLLTPYIGEIVMLNDTLKNFTKWWENN